MGFKFVQVANKLRKVKMHALYKEEKAIENREKL